MAFNPLLPVNGSLITAAELRGQFNDLKTELDALPTQTQLSNDLVNCQNAAVLTALPQTSSNSNGVSLLNMTVSDPPTQGEMQTIADKINELIQALRR